MIDDDGRYIGTEQNSGLFAVGNFIGTEAGALEDGLTLDGQQVTLDGQDLTLE